MKVINLNKIKKNKLVFDKKGKYLVFLSNISGEFLFEIKAEKVELSIYGLFFGKGNEKYNVSVKQDHIFPKSKSNLLIRGVFFDQASFSYQGLIRVEKKAQYTQAYQENNNLILSNKAFVSSQPFLEILANKVSCSHGSTISQLNKDQIFYLQTRGLNINQAKDLLVQGFINNLFDKIEDEVENKELIPISILKFQDSLKSYYD